jgi:hypothetical protein
MVRSQNLRPRKRTRGPTINLWSRFIARFNALILQQSTRSAAVFTLNQHEALDDRKSAVAGPVVPARADSTDQQVRRDPEGRTGERRRQNHNEMIGKHNAIPYASSIPSAMINKRYYYQLDDIRKSLRT